MENDKWYTKLLAALLLILLSPLILLFLAGACIDILFRRPREKKEYEISPYYKQFKQKFHLGIVDLAEYRVYNSVTRRSLPIEYKCVSDDLDYFVYNDTLFLLSYYDQLEWDDENKKWLIAYDGDLFDFEDGFSKVKEQLQYTGDMPVKLFIERQMIDVDDLTATPLPDDVYVTWSYDDVFEYDDNPFMKKLPTTTGELFDEMLKIPDLCGELELDGDIIKWRLYDGYLVELSLDGSDGYVSIDKKINIIHWIPLQFELCDTVLKMAARGNVLVIRSGLFSSETLYCGKKADCPYTPEQKPLLGKLYFLETV